MEELHFLESIVNEGEKGPVRCVEFPFPSRWSMARGDGGLKPDVGASCECADSERASELGVSLHLTLRRVEVAKCCTRFTRFKDIQSNQNLDASLPRSYT